MVIVPSVDAQPRTSALHYALLPILERTKFRWASFRILGEATRAETTFEDLPPHLQSGVINIFDNFVEQLALLLLPSDAHGLAAGFVTQAAPKSLLESAIVK